MRKQIISAVLGLSVAATAMTGLSLPVSAEANSPQYQENARVMEDLNRGLIAVKTTKDTREQTVDGVYLSWRLLGTESLENQAFDIYKNGTKLYTTGVHDATNYIDTAGTTSDRYKVVPAGASQDVVNAEPEVTPYPENYYAKPSEVGAGNSLKHSFTYVDIPISRPADVSRMGDGKTSHYYTIDKDHEGGANDASVGDLDGDGDYEIVLKWDPTDSKDSAGSDFTGNVYIDAYEIDPNNGGEYMWRIDLGQNVTAGAHYTQFLVYDFDGDGRAEIAMKTAPGTIDGTGKYVTEVGDTEEIRNIDNKKSYIGTSGRLKGKNPFTQFLTIFDGSTGEALYTTDFIPYEMHEKTYWGDGSAKYNRSERYLAAVAYLDGVHPSIVMCRGYYHEAVVRAYNWDGTELTMLWEHDGAKKGDTSLYGQGNHNLSVGDIDNDGKDEIVYGSAALDDNGVAMGNTYLGHGDAMHMSDFNNDGVQEVFSVKEDSEGYKKYAADLRVASTGEHFWESGKIVTSDDNGKGLMGNIDDAYAAEHSNALALGWDSGHDNVHDLNGNDLKAKPASAGSGSFDNSLVYWDGDLGRELLDANIIQKYNAEDGTTKRYYGPSDGYTLTGGSTNNYTKRNASLTADLWGDWREEIIMPTGTGKDDTPALRIYTSTTPTDYRLTTLMHDSQYRLAVAWQNVAYNMPPHTSYYIGTAALATDENGNKLNYLAPKTKFTKVVYETESIPVTGMSLSEENLRVEKGSTEILKANIEPSNATRKAVTWTSSNPDVATVANGIVKGVSEGKATITATTRDGGFSDTCEVEVYMTHVSGINMEENEIAVGVGASKPIKASVKPENATEKDIEWKSSNASVAAVDANGNVTGVSMGSAVVTATTKDGNYSAQCTVKVYPMVTTDVTGENVFETSNTDAETTLTSGADNAVFSQAGAKVNGEFHKSFTPYKDNKAAISFKFNTGGKKDANNAWNWEGREYTFGLQFLDTDGENILTIGQSYNADGAQTTTSKAGDMSFETLTSVWDQTVVSGENPIGRSSTTWLINLEFDYDNDTCTATLQGQGKDDDGNPVPGIAYSHSFSLNGASFETLKYYTEIDGSGTIDVGPTLSELSYTRTETDIVEGVTNVLYDKGTSSDTAWTQNDLSDWEQTNTSTAALQLDESVGNGRIYYSATKPGASYSASKTFDVSDNAVVTYNADWYFGNATSRTTNFEFIQFGSNLRIGWCNGANLGYMTWVSTDGGNTWNDMDGDGETDNIFSGNNATFTKNVQVVVDTSTNTIQSLSFDGAKLDAYTNYKLPENDACNSVSFGFYRGGSTDNWDYIVGLDSLMVSEFVEGKAPATEPPSATPTAEPTDPPKPEPTPGPDDVISIVSVDNNTVETSIKAYRDDEKIYVIGALYNAAGALAEVKLIPVENVSAGDTIEKSIGFATLFEDGFTVKICAWDSMGVMKPLYDAADTQVTVPNEAIFLQDIGEFEELGDDFVGPQQMAWDLQESLTDDDYIIELK